MKVVSLAGTTVRKDAVKDGIRTRHIDYFGDLKGLDDGPQGFMVEKTITDEADPGLEQILVTPAHYHRVRQFQLVVRGRRTRIGAHDTPAVSFHYVDASSPYGPIYAGKDGVSWFTLRSTADVGAYFMPGSKSRMRGRAGRNVVVGVEPKGLPSAGVESETLIERHEDGLAAYRLRLGPNATAIAPDPAETGGHYYWVAAGSILHEGETVDPWCLGWAGPGDGPAELQAGPEGADVLVLQFPLVTADETIDVRELDPAMLPEALSPPLAEKLGISLTR